MFTHWAFIYLGTGAEDPAVDRAVIERGGLRTTIVAVPDRAAVVPVAEELVAAGAQSIELCGGFGTEAAAGVVAALAGRVPVGSVTYGMESIHALAALFPADAGGASAASLHGSVPASPEPAGTRRSAAD
jgi:hypothetical protein